MPAECRWCGGPIEPPVEPGETPHTCGACDDTLEGVRAAVRHAPRCAEPVSDDLEPQDFGEGWLPMEPEEEEWFRQGLADIYVNTLGGDPDDLTPPCEQPRQWAAVLISAVLVAGAVVLGALLWAALTGG